MGRPAYNTYLSKVVIAEITENIFTNRINCGIIRPFKWLFGRLAQLGERMLRMYEVEGSNPLSSTTFKNRQFSAEDCRFLYIIKQQCN